MGSAALYVAEPLYQGAASLSAEVSGGKISFGDPVLLSF